MSKEVKKTGSIEKAPSGVEKINEKPVRAIQPRRHEPSQVLANFDGMLNDFRKRFRESLWTPWEWAIEPYRLYEVEFPVRAAYADLVDEGTKFLVRAEAPGISRDKINVTVSKDGVEISGETSEEKEEKEKSYVVRERNYSSIYKNIAFTEEVIPEKAECSLKDGILEVSVPKKTSTPPVKKHKVEVKEAK